MLRRYLLLLDLFYSTHWNVLMDSTRRKPMVNVVGLWKIRLLFCFASFRVSIQCTSSGFDSFFWLRWGLLSSRLFVQEIIRSILFIIWFCCACILLTSFSSHSVTLYHTAWPVHPCRLTNLRIIFLTHFTFCVTANRGNLGLLFRFEEAMRISCSEFRQEVRARLTVLVCFLDSAAYWKSSTSSFKNSEPKRTILGMPISDRCRCLNLDSVTQDSLGRLPSACWKYLVWTALLPHVWICCWSGTGMG